MEAKQIVTIQTAGDADGRLGLQIRDNLAAEGETVKYRLFNDGSETPILDPDVVSVEPLIVGTTL